MIIKSNSPKGDVYLLTWTEDTARFTAKKESAYIFETNEELEETLEHLNEKMGVRAYKAE